MWCYSLGVLVALTLPSTDLVQALLLAQGGLIALSLILIDEVDNAYGDAYSGAVSAHSLLPRWSIRRWGLAGRPMHGPRPGAAHAQPGAVPAAAQLGVRAVVRRHPGAPGVWHPCPIAAGAGWW